jgi:NADH-quinone oxidoreductase subunit L
MNYWFLWLIPALPLLGFLLNVFVIRQERQAGYLASATVLAAFAVSIGATVILAGLPAEERHMGTVAWEWINTGALRVPFGLHFDPLSAVMALLVTGVGGLIHIYSIGYMHGDRRVTRYFAYLNLFVAMMLILVLANNMLLLFLGWEGVGLCSFLLIGYWFERKSASSAAVKAFIVNRVGDAAFLVAMMSIFSNFGTLNFHRVEYNGQVYEGFVERAAELAGRTFGPTWQLIPVVGGITFLLLVGVAGKSAQIPLFVWLPDAMAGPTPVSALIHAATMVTAGVYLMARVDTLFTSAGSAQGLVVWVGALTAIIGACAAITQWDIKRVLAYSTISQLGYMVAACGMGIYGAAIFHLLTHGAFKALLFLGSGSVIHATHDVQDMRRMGGLRKHLPTTFRTYLIGSAALAGIFPFAGFWSKDEILAHAATHGQVTIFIILTLTSLLTAFYMGRQVALVFYGEQRDTSYKAHESGRIMTVPLIILAVLAVLGGLLNLPAFVAGMPGAGLLTTWLQPLLGEAIPPYGAAQIAISLVVTLASAGMAYLGWSLYLARAPRIKIGGKDPLYRYMGDIWDLFEEGFYFDRIFERYTAVPFFRNTASFLARVFDPQGIHGLVRGVGQAFGAASVGLRALQSGYVRSYAFFFLIGVVLILGFLVLGR